MEFDTFLRLFDLDLPCARNRVPTCHHEEKVGAKEGGRGRVKSQGEECG